MEEGLLSLKWNNHKSTFFQVLSILREKHTYTDVTLACDGRLYPAHKFVLSTCSEYFSDIFTSTSGNNIVIVLKDVRRQDLEYLLDYMYLGQVDVAQSELSSLIKTAECLRIKGLAIPDDEPQKTPRRVAEEREREGSPPVKKKRHLVDEDRGNNLSSNSSASRLPHLTLPPPSLPPPSQPQPALLQRLQQQPTLAQPPQPQSSSQAGGSKSHVPPLPQSVATPPQTPRTPQVPTSPLPPTSAHQVHPPISSPTQSSSALPVIKQEVADPPEAPEVYMNEGYDEQETKPDVSEAGHLEQDLAVPGPSGLQGPPENWDGDNDLAGFSGGDGYPEGRMEEAGDSEVQGERHRGAAPRPQARWFAGYGASWQASGTQSSTSSSSGALFTPPAPKASPSALPYPLPHGDSGALKGGVRSQEARVEGAPRAPPIGSKAVESRLAAAGPVAGGGAGSGGGGAGGLGGGPWGVEASDRTEASEKDLAGKGDAAVARAAKGGPLECPWCQKVLSKPSNLKVHIRRHTGEKPYHCLFCPYSAAQKVQVINHMNARHHQTSANSFFLDYKAVGVRNAEGRAPAHPLPPMPLGSPPTCSLTDALLARPQTSPASSALPACNALYPAAMTGTSGLPLQAEVGDEFAHDLATLQKSGGAADGSATLVCPYCGKVSRCLSHLQTHIRIHTGERPYACSYCQFRTTQKVALKEHIYTHTGEKPHVCPHCDFRCAKKCNLNSHIRRHHGAQAAGVHLPESIM